MYIRGTDILLPDRFWFFFIFCGCVQLQRGKPLLLKPGDGCGLVIGGNQAPGFLIFSVYGYILVLQENPSFLIKKPIPVIATVNNLRYN